MLLSEGSDGTFAPEAVRIWFWWDYGSCLESSSMKGEKQPVCLTEGPSAAFAPTASRAEQLRES